jgi:hypothetical protein
MQEAFRRALQNNPDTDLRRDIKRVEQNVWDEKRAETARRRRLKEITELSRTMKAFGQGWCLYESLGGAASTAAAEYLAKLRQNWEEKSLTREFSAATEAEREVF